MNIGDTLTVRRGQTIGTWRRVEDFTGQIDGFRRSGDADTPAIDVDSAEAADLVILHAWVDDHGFAAHCYVVARMSEIVRSAS